MGDERLIATELPDSPAGRQMAWFIEASTRLPLGDAEWRAHFADRFLALPGTSPAELDTLLGQVIDARGVQLRGVVVAEPDALVALVALPDGRELVITFVVDRAGLVEYATLQPAGSGPEVRLPGPTGSAAVGTDRVQLVDRARAGRRLHAHALVSGRRRSRPPAARAVRQPAARPRRSRCPPCAPTPGMRARPRRGRLPVVLFSPGLGTPRVIYQALAEDLASHGYLVIAVDHTGEAPVEFADGHFALPALPPRRPIAAAAVTRLADMRLILRRLPRLPSGPRADLGRIAAIGHSFGGSISAALMRVEPRIRAGVDMDGSIFGAASRRGVPRAFLVMTGGRGLDRNLRGTLRRSRGPRLGALLRGAGAPVLQRPGRHRPRPRRHAGSAGAARHRGPARLPARLPGPLRARPPLPPARAPVGPLAAGARALPAIVLLLTHRRHR